MRIRHAHSVRPPARRIAAALSLALLTALATPATAQNGPDPGHNNGDASTADQTPTRISFAFKNAPIDQVVDFFARESGLPVIEETDIPTGTVTFISDREYPLDQALAIVNTILRTRGVRLRQDTDFLYLGKVEDMQREPVPTFEGELPDALNGEEIVTLVIPLRNVEATPIAQNLRGLIASYGSIVAMPAQNTVVLTETVDQVRRLGNIIRSLDDEPPFQEAVRLFELEHIDAREALQTLNVLEIGRAHV